MSPEPVEAATVILVRDPPAPSPPSAAPRGIEVLLLRRHAGARFAAGAHVFPGGAVDDDDRGAAAAAAC
ncbi:MAG TPA: hypothetical protein VFO65_03255, partial [Acidimicrobiales bacterium]|nr:hypothetical protein [Acidimicrobiales bacterium]